MADEDLLPPAMLEHLQSASNQQLLKFFDQVRQLAGFDVEPTRLQAFRDAHRWLVQRPQSPGIARLKAKEPGKRDWHAVLSNGLLGHTQNAFRGVLYRLGVLAQIEDSIHELAHRTGIDNILAKSGLSIGGGDTLRLDCEYQDFILSVRRTLDYLAHAVGAYFRQDCWSFRDLAGGNVLKWAPSSVASTLHSRLSEHSASFQRFLSTGDRKTVRDRITHREFVPAGILNATPLGIFLVGGGEELHAFKEGRLLPQLEAHVDALEAIIVSVVRGLIAGDGEAFEQPSAERLHDFCPESEADDRLKRRMIERTRGQWNDTPFVSRTTDCDTVWQCMICGWKSKSWPPNGFESSSQYYEAEDEASSHIQAHRYDERHNAGEGAGEREQVKE